MLLVSRQLRLYRGSDEWGRRWWSSRGSRDDRSRWRREDRGPGQAARWWYSSWRRDLTVAHVAAGLVLRLVGGKVLQTFHHVQRILIHGQFFVDSVVLGVEVGVEKGSVLPHLVGLDVLAEVVAPHELLLALRTLEPLFPSVCTPMSLQLVRPSNINFKILKS